MEDRLRRLRKSMNEMEFNELNFTEQHKKNIKKKINQFEKIEVYEFEKLRLKKSRKKSIKDNKKVKSRKSYGLIASVVIGLSVVTIGLKFPVYANDFPVINNIYQLIGKEKIESEIHIPLNLEESVETLNGKPTVKVKDNGDGGHLVTAFYKTDKFDVLTSQDSNHYGEVEPLIDYIKKTMYGHKEVKEIKVKGNKAVISERDNGFDHLHVVTKDYMYTIAGAETEELLKIAEQIDFK